MGTAEFETGIGIDLDEPWLKVLIDHEVEPQQLKVVGPAGRIEDGVGGAKGLGGKVLHAGEYGVVEAGLAGVVGLEVLVELSIGEFVGLFVLAVVGCVLLDGVVGEVDEGVLGCTRGELSGGGAHVPLLVPVPLHPSIHAAHQHVVAQVELPPVVEQWVLDVLLEDEGAQLAVPVPLPSLQPHLDVVQSVAHSYPRPPVSVLPRLHDPDVAQVLLGLTFLLDAFVVGEEAEVLWVISAFVDVEGEG